MNGRTKISFYKFTICLKKEILIIDITKKYIMKSLFNFTRFPLSIIKYLQNAKKKR